MLTRLSVLAALSVGYAASPAAWGADLPQSPMAYAAAEEVAMGDTLPAEPGSPAVDSPRRNEPAHEAGTPDEAAIGTPRSDVPRVKGKGARNLQRLTPEQVIDARVRRLAKMLALDEAQQARLRAVLQSERQQINSIWRDNPHPGADRVGPMLAILDRTREEIRAMLNEEQRKNYPAAVPRDSTAPANVDVDYWMRLTRPAPPEGAVQGN